MEFKKLLEAAEAGDAKAQVEMFYLFQEEAKKWFEKAVLGGGVSLGSCCMNFQDILKKAEDGDADSQYQIGVILEEWSKDWYGKAALCGHEGAWEKLGFERDPFYDKMTEKYGKKNKDKKE